MKYSNMKKTQKKYSSDLEFEALLERAKIQASMLRNRQDDTLPPF
jgi:hypothetical protein